MYDLYGRFGTKERKEERKKYLQTVNNIHKFVKILSRVQIDAYTSILLTKNSTYKQYIPAVS